MSYVKTRVEGIRGIVEIDRPEGRNALDGESWRAIAAAAAAHDGAAQVRTILVQSTGSVFCAGGDLDWMLRSEPAELVAAATALDALAAVGKPVVARVHGPAYGGGVGLAAACDLVVAAHNVRFQMTEVRVGVAPAMVSRAVIGRIGGALFAAGRCSRAASRPPRLSPPGLSIASPSRTSWTPRLTRCARPCVPASRARSRPSNGCFRLASAAPRPRPSSAACARGPPSPRASRRCERSGRHRG